MQADSVNLHDNAFGASRGYEPEAGGFAGDMLDADELPDDGELDEHAEMTEPKGVKKGRNALDSPHQIGAVAHLGERLAMALRR